MVLSMESTKPCLLVVTARAAQLQAVFLQMAGDVLTGQGLHVHHLCSRDCRCDSTAWNGAGGALSVIWRDGIPRSEAQALASGIQSACTSRQSVLAKGQCIMGFLQRWTVWAASVAEALHCPPCGTPADTNAASSFLCKSQT